jgi:hypothetical protein
VGRRDAPAARQPQAETRWLSAGERVKDPVSQCGGKPTTASSRAAVSRIKTLSWIRERLRRRANPKPATSPAFDPEIPRTSKT